MCVAVCNVHDRARLVLLCGSSIVSPMFSMLSGRAPKYCAAVTSSCAANTTHSKDTKTSTPNQSPKPKARGCNSKNLHGFKVERRVGQLGVQRRSARIAAGAALNQQENADCILLAAGNFGAFGKQPHLGGKCQCGSEARVQRNARDAAVFFSGAGTCIETASTSFCRRLKPCSGVLASISSSRSSTDRSVRAIGCRGSRAAIEREGARSGNTPAWR